MKKLLFILLSFAILSCSKKEVKLPTLSEKGIQELYNHSQIWMFFEIKNNDTIADVNRKNTISTTHWIFNIDKRLPLKTIIPSIIDLQDKHANSLHSEKGMHNYFSYSDTISQQLSFLEFDGVSFKTDNILSKNYIEENRSNYTNCNNINIIFNPTSIWINSEKIEKEHFKDRLLEIITSSPEEKQPMLHLNFNENLTYQDFLYYKTMIHNLKIRNVFINQIEFIFSQTKVQD